MKPRRNKKAKIIPDLNDGSEHTETRTGLEETTCFQEAHAERAADEGLERAADEGLEDVEDGKVEDVEDERDEDDLLLDLEDVMLGNDVQLNDVDDVREELVVKPKQPNPKVEKILKRLRKPSERIIKMKLKKPVYDEDGGGSSNDKPVNID